MAYIYSKYSLRHLLDISQGQGQTEGCGWGLGGVLESIQCVKEPWTNNNFLDDYSIYVANAGNFLFLCDDGGFT